MHVISILHNLFAVCRSSFDLRVLKTLFSAVETLTRCRKLAITSIGRSLVRDCHVKHKIKTIDRLFGNIKLQSSTFIIYKSMLLSILGRNLNPIILVDWSRLSPCGNFHFLSAAIPSGGRALPILEIPFHVNHLETFKSHSLFLQSLNDILPKNVKPIIITDAGFRNCWFKLVSSYGWNYIGRLRNRTCFQTVGSVEWKAIKSLYSFATRKAKYLGHYLLSKSTTISTHLYLYKGSNKNRIKKNLEGKKVQCSESLKHAKREAEPLLIATSLSFEAFKPHEIINLYKKRMQIEETFRDLKNERLGLSLRQNGSKSLGRLQVALLIGAMTIYILWILGVSARLNEVHFHYQANTTRHLNVLSNFMIGWQLLEEKRIILKLSDINQALQHLKEVQSA